MRQSFFVNRILTNYFKILIVIFFLLEPSFEIAFYVYEITLGGAVSRPEFAFFLTCNTASYGHVFQSVYNWFLPLYLLVLVAEDCLEEYRTGYKNILICKMGKKNYIKSHLKKAFIFSFSIMLAGLILNLILVTICFFGGQFSTYGNDPYSPGDSFLKWSFTNPYAADILFAMITAFCGGMIAMAGTMIALVTENRKITYAVMLLIWLIAVLSDNSIVLVFQPFSEYSIDKLGPIFLCVAAFYLLLVVILYLREVHSEKI